MTSSVNHCQPAMEQREATATISTCTQPADSADHLGTTAVPTANRQAHSNHWCGLHFCTGGLTAHRSMPSTIAPGRHAYTAGTHQHTHIRVFSLPAERTYMLPTKKEADTCCHRHPYPRANNYSTGTAFCIPHAVPACHRCLQKQQQQHAFAPTMASATSNTTWHLFSSTTSGPP